MAEDYFRYKPFKKKPGRFFQLITTVMFVDVVGFTTYGDNDDLRNAVRRLQDIIGDVFHRLHWDEEQGPNEAIMIPTGDGYGIGFDPARVPDEEILRHAATLSTKLSEAHLGIRMGINKGPCWVHQDLNAQLNLAGWGIIDAARAMACGSKNHILCTEQFAAPYLQSKSDRDLHPLGVHSFKGRELTLYNYYSEEKGFGNPETPEKSK